jgi:hypothetical protein
MTMNDPVSFQPHDAQQLIDLLNPDPTGAGKPAPVRQMLCCLVFIMSGVPARASGNPGQGTARILITTIIPGPEPWLDRLVWNFSPFTINVRSWRSYYLPGGTIVVARREELRNQWTV